MFSEFVAEGLKNFDIALVQEPYVGNLGHIRPKGGLSVFQNKTNSPVRAAIIVFNKKVEVFMIAEHSDSDCIVVEIKLKNNSLIVCCVYNPPDTDITPLTLKWSSMASSYPRLIIAGDMNSSHDLWTGKGRADQNGLKIVDFSIAESFDILNSGFAPTFVTKRNGRLISSIVDLTLASQFFAHKITNWTVDPGVVVGSDHNAITFEIIIDINVEQSNDSTYIYRTANANWDKFNTLCHHYLFTNGLTTSQLLSIRNIEELDSHVTALTACIRKACDQSIQKRKRKSYNCPWWSEELQGLKRKVAKSKRTLGTNICLSHDQKVLNDWDQAKEEFKEAIGKAVKQSWQSFLERQNKDDVWSNIYRVMKDASPQRLLTTLKVNGIFTEDNEETAEAILNHFYPDDNQNNDMPEHVLMREEMYDICDGQPETSFTENELMDVINKVNPNKAPGLDGLTADIIKEFAKNNLEYLLTLFNQCLKLGLFPTTWKEAYVKILPKPGKDDYNQLTSYRPIGLLPVLGKILEALFINRMTWDFYRTGKLSLKQFGFRPQTSSVDALRKLISEIEKWKKKEDTQVMMVSLDIKAAFDNAFWPYLIQSLKARGIKSNLQKLILHYLVSRKAVLKLGAVQVSKNLTKGCIQGSVCGPTFWNVVIDELLDIRLPPGCHIQAFADDVVLVAHNTSPPKLKQTVEEALTRIIEWGTKAKLEFSRAKTQVIAFTAKAKKLDIMFDGHKLELSKWVKVLGVVIDHRLKFTEHVKYAVNKSARIYGHMMRMARANWGLNSGVVDTIYRMAVEPTVTYAAVIWERALKFKYIRKLLEKFQRPYAIRIIKGFHTVSTNSALALAGLIPLDLKIKEVKTIEEAKFKSKFMDSDSIVEVQSRHRFTDKAHPSTRPKATTRIISNASNLDTEWSGISIFTDGSKDGDNVGASYVLYSNNEETTAKKFKLGRCCSVFQAELLAIKQALLWVINCYSTRHISGASIRSGQQPEVIKLFSDSQSAVIAISDRNSPNVIVNEILTIIQEIEARNLVVYIAWIKAHFGITGNERADQLAKEASTEDCDTIYSKAPISYVKIMARKVAINKWNDRYLSLTTGATTKMFFPTINDVLKFNKATTISFELTQLLTGHAFTMAHAKRFNLSEHDKCKCDNIRQQTITHIVLDCPLFNDIRPFTPNSASDCDRLSIMRKLICDNSTRETMVDFLTKAGKLVKAINNI